jgi:hypothetical protein
MVLNLSPLINMLYKRKSLVWYKDVGFLIGCNSVLRKETATKPTLHMVHSQL